MRERFRERPGRRGRALGRAALETAAFVLAFVAFGLAWAALERQARPAPPYAGGVSEAARQGEEVWLVDGYNVLCAGLLGGRDRSEWWSEPRRQELLQRLEAFPEPAAELWVVFDGPGAAPQAETAPPGRARAVFAASADEWIVARAAAAPAGAVVVVTADRRVAARARHRGARVVTPSELLRRCPA